MLLKSDYNVDEQLENMENKVYESKDGRRYNFLFVSKKEGKLLKIVHSSKRKEKISIRFSSENNIFAKNIIFQHQNIKLRIEFNYFKNQ